jgi:MurNAc alpha-1-phosphate uridylyltransferase
MMEGMILAAGAGTRLRPLTNRIPKALVEVGGRPILASVIERLVDAGCSRIIVNTHHHENQIRSFLTRAEREGLDIVVSSEPDGPLDTGGGLFHAASLFRGSTPLLLHNVDVYSGISLSDVLSIHRESAKKPESKVIATLAVQDRGSNRRLLFDDLGLIGWENQGSPHALDGKRQVRDSVGVVQGVSFSGIHVIEPNIFNLSKRTGSFSIVTLYLELAREGWEIKPVDVTGQPWFDIGTPARLEQVRSWAMGPGGRDGG